MYIRRKVYSLLQDESGEEKLFSTTEFELEQKEFANKHNKELKRQWQMQKGYDKTMKLYPDLSKKEQNRYISAKNSKTLPGDGSKGYEAMNKEVRKIADRQETLLNRGRETTINGVEVRENTQRRRGVKKVKGAKVATPITPESIKARKSELMSRYESKGGTRANLVNRVNSRKQQEAAKVAQQTTQTATQSTTQAATKQAEKAVQNVVKDNNQTKQGLMKRATTWAKKNPKLAIGGSLGALAVGGTGGMLYRNYKKNKDK